MIVGDFPCILHEPEISIHLDDFPSYEPPFSWGIFQFANIGFSEKKIHELSIL